MKVLITGGHFSPAHILIKELVAKGHEVAIGGRKHSFEGEVAESYEYHIAKKENIHFFEIRTGRLQRKFTKHTIPSIFKISLGFLDSLSAIRGYRPDVVVTFGGYIGFPVAYTAALFRIPVILHEQTQKAGLASKFIAFVAGKICISFESSAEYFSRGKTVFTGNPIRDEIFNVKKKIKIPEFFPVLYVTGGSTGSHRINTMVGLIIEKLLKTYVVIHQVGDSRKFLDYEKLSNKRKNFSSDMKARYILRKFIFPEEIGFVLAVSDLVISRSGINTVTELLALGKTSLLIPLSGGQINEQLDNAKLIRNIGIGDYIEDVNVTEEFLLDKIKKMIEEKSDFEKNKKKASAYIVKGAVQKIIAVIEEVYGKKNN